jgi:hypothetical protein
MRERTKRRSNLLVAVATALALVALVTLPASARDLDAGGTVAAERDSAPLAGGGGGQGDESRAGLDRRMSLYFGAAGEETLAAALSDASVPLSFRGGRGPWTSLLSLNPIQGLFLGVGASSANTIVGAGDHALNEYGLGLGGAYRSDALTLYLLGIKDFNRPGDASQSSGDFTTYQISAGGMMARFPFAIGFDLFYLDRGEQERLGETGFAATPGGAGEMTFSAEQVLLGGFFDGGNAVNRWMAGGAKASAPGVGSPGQGKSAANIRAIGGHVDFRPMTETVLQLGGAYLQFVEDVTSGRGGSMEESLGTSMYLRLAHGITDTLQLKAAFDYLFPADGASAAKADEEAYKVAAGLFWSW